jgi:hypothetical protein
MENSLPTSSEPSAPLPPLTISEALQWLLLLPLILLVGGRSGLGTYHALFAILLTVAPDVLFLADGGGGRLVTSLVMGTIVAVLLSLVWQRQQFVVPGLWLRTSVVALSSSIFLMDIALYADCEAYPPGWVLLAAIGSGVLLGSLDRVFLMRQVRSSGWWILILASNWTLYWYGLRVLACTD